MLYTSFNMSLAIQESLSALDNARDELDRYVQLPNEYTGELRRHALAQSVHYSTQIEGNTLTLEQVESLVAGERISAPDDQMQEAHNYKEALNYIQTIVATDDYRITEETIRAVHYMVGKSLPGKYAPGRYRTEQSYIVDRNSSRRIFVPPPPERVPDLMRELVSWLNSGQALPSTIRAALAHLNLVAIHPFLDGNGRTARLVDTLIMYIGGFRSQELVSIESHFGRDSQGYYRAISAALGPRYSPSESVTAWLEYYLNAHVEHATSAGQVYAEIVAEIDGLQGAFGLEGLSTSQILALWLSCRRGRITNRMYRGMTEHSAQSAATDFAKLMDKDLLARVGRGRSVAYVPTARVQEAFDAIWEGVAQEDG